MSLTNFRGTHISDLPAPTGPGRLNPCWPSHQHHPLAPPVPKSSLATRGRYQAPRSLGCCPAPHSSLQHGAWGLSCPFRPGASRVSRWLQRMGHTRRRIPSQCRRLLGRSMQCRWELRPWHRPIWECSSPFRWSVECLVAQVGKWVKMKIESCRFLSCQWYFFGEVPVVWGDNLLVISDDIWWFYVIYW